MRIFIFLMNLIISTSVVFAADDKFVPEEISNQAPIQFENIEVPFMTCETSDKESDVVSFTLMVSLMDKKKGTAIGMRNSRYEKDEIEELQLIHPEKDFSNFKVSPIYSLVPGNVSIKKVSNDEVEITVSAFGLVTINQKINLSVVEQQIVVAGKNYSCSLVPDVL